MSAIIFQPDKLFLNLLKLTQTDLNFFVYLR